MKTKDDNDTIKITIGGKRSGKRLKLEEEIHAKDFAEAMEILRRRRPATKRKR